MRWAWIRFISRKLGGRPDPVGRDREADKGRAAAHVALVAVLVAVPAGALAGVFTFDARTSAAAEQAEEGNYVVAVLEEDASQAAGPGGPAGPILGPVTAQAAWRTSGGEQHREQVEVAPELRAGDAAPVWLDADGNAVAAPATAAQAAAAGIFVAIQVMVLAWLAVAAGYGLVRMVLRWTFGAR